MEDRKNRLQQFFRGRFEAIRKLFHKTRVAVRQQVREQAILLTVGKYPRLVITLLFYIGELLFLIYSIQLLTENILGFRLFSALTGRGPVKWLFDLLWSLPPVQSTARVVEEMTKDGGVGEMISAVGAGGIFFTLLTGAEEKRVCGVKTGKLLNWLHKFFFLAYVLLFLPLLSLGIYAGYAKKGRLAAYAFLGIFSGLLLTLLACFELALSADWRERLALQYYDRQLHPGITKRLCIRLRQKNRYGGSPTEFDDAQRTMLNIADYLRSQAKEYHQDVSPEMVLLWIRSCGALCDTDVDYPHCDPSDEERLAKLPSGTEIDFGGITRGEDGKDRFELRVKDGFHYPNEYLSDGQDCIITNAISAKDIWAALLREETSGKMLEAQNQLVICQILHSLYYVSKPDKRRLVVLLGLLFYLEDKAEGDDKQLIEWVDTITKGTFDPDRRSNVPREARHNLAWALLMIRVVAWIWQGKMDEQGNTIDQFCQCFGPELSQRGKTEESDKCQEMTLLWYAEWSARKRCGLSLNRYLLGISTLYNTENGFKYLRQDTLTYRKRFLMQVLSANYPWRGKKEGGKQQ